MSQFAEGSMTSASWGASAPSGAAGRVGRGIVPLRPLQVGEILDGAVTAMRAYPGIMLGLSTMVVAVGQAVAMPLDYLYLRYLAGLVDSSTTLGSGTGINDLALLRPSVLLNALVVSLLVGLLTTTVSRAVLGRPVTLAEVWAATRPKLPRLIGLAVLVFFILFGALAVGILPGALIVAGGQPSGNVLIFFGAIAAVGFVVNRWVAWSLAAAALVLEDQPIRKALKRSSVLVKGAWWRVLGIALLGLLVAELVVLILALLEQAVLGGNLSPVTDNGDGTFTGHQVSMLYVFLGALFSTAIQAIVGPFIAAVVALQYVDRRMRREGLDIQLGMNARGASSAGSGGSGGFVGSGSPGGPGNGAAA